MRRKTKVSIVLSGLSIAIPMITFFLWIVTILLICQLPYTKRLRNRIIMSRTIYGISILSLGVGFLWLLLVIAAWIVDGWLFVEGLIKVQVPIFLLGNVPVVMLALPQLRLYTIDRQETLSIESKIIASNPKLRIPFFAAALSSAIGFYLHLFAQPIDPSLLEMITWPLLLLILLFIPSFFVIRRYERALQGQDIWFTGWQRWLKGFLPIALMVLLVISIVGVNVLIGINTTKLPASSDMMNHDHIDEGGGTPTMHGNRSHHHSDIVHDQMVKVKDLREDPSVPVDRRFTLVAQQKEIVLQSGKKLKAWTYNGQLAPELRVKQGEMVQVKLINRDIAKGVTIHWHGYNVPNAMDGVPGMTQNVVKPGQTFTYQFRAKQIGTFWFHSHQQASEQVTKGLFGSLIVEAKKEVHPYDVDVTVINHRWNIGNHSIMTFRNHDQEQRKSVKAGQKIRVRIINTDKLSRQYFLSGTHFQVTSIDGVPIQKPGRLSSNTTLQIAAGGRYDLTFTMPNHPVRLGMKAYEEEGKPSTHMLSLLFDNGHQPVKSSLHMEKVAKEKVFDPADYGTGVQNPLTSTQKFDRSFQMIMGNRMGFYNGKLNYLWTINGEVYPRTPTFVVKRGEKVKITFVNRSLTEHPMHLHGHHMTVLKKNGRKVKTPWLTDTLNVQMGESYEVAVFTDNSGMWMDHCHNLDHAAVGMTMHLMYDHVLPSYEVGTKSGNIPD
jgi:FtsP/CotA-like multicopper oxidase with cupredoxin domain